MHILLYLALMCTSYVLALHIQQPRAESMESMRAQWEQLGWITSSGLNNDICYVAAQKLLLERHTTSEIREIHGFLDPLLMFEDIERVKWPLKDKLAFRLLLTVKDNNAHAPHKMRMLHTWADLIQKENDREHTERCCEPKKAALAAGYCAATYGCFQTCPEFGLLSCASCCVCSCLYCLCCARSSHPSVEPAHRKELQKTIKELFHAIFEHDTNFIERSLGELESIVCPARPDVAQLLIDLSKQNIFVHYPPDTIHYLQKILAEPFKIE